MEATKAEHGPWDQYGQRPKAQRYTPHVTALCSCEVFTGDDRLAIHLCVTHRMSGALAADMRDWLGGYRR